MVLNKWKLLIILIYVILAGTQAFAFDDKKRCVLCGMDLNKYPHSIYTAKWKNGEETQTCGVQCGLSLQLMKPDNFKSSHATDLITNRRFPVSDGFYVFKSTVTTDMGPGFIAFKTRVNAEKFQKGFGGQIMTHEEALKIWSKFLKKRK
jgi:nitrous oxide reductase accessory protein NosL